MHHSKLVRQLRILTAPELKRLLQFLKSPFYNANPAIVKLYLLLREHHPEFASPALAKEKVFRKIFPGRAYDHQKLLNLMSDFTALLEQYLVALQLEKEEIKQKKLLVQAYSERPDCYDVFEKKVWELDKTLDAMPYRDELYFREKKDLNLLYFGHPGTDMVTNGREALINALKNFEAFKTLTAAKLQCSLNAWENAVGAAKTVANASNGVDTSNPLLILYKKLAVLQDTHDSTADLGELVGLFITHIRTFRPDDQSNVLKILLNYCNRLINKGKTEFVSTSFELHKTGLEYDCFLVNGKLNEQIFHNIVTAGTRCREFDWTRHFMENYQYALDASVRENALALAMGQWYFEQQEYTKAIEILNHTFSEPQDIYKSKGLTIRAWCELYWKDDSYFDLLLAQLDAFDKYLRRNRNVAPRLSEGMLKFTGYTRKLALLKWDGKYATSLKTEIMKESNVAFKNWLLSK
ncbi:MAG: hypothetical protein DYG98_15695 [Haliscomenobacteraceae bacterium CHB4]|nr:hypothetical protein [Saprospiraceae bacterium]MCE7924489.1 hypothetical protein [Haliscomenobacteraceae bacterium CHB4]